MRIGLAQDLIMTLILAKGCGDGNSPLQRAHVWTAAILGVTVGTAAVKPVL